MRLSHIIFANSDMENNTPGMENHAKITVMRQVRSFLCLILCDLDLPLQNLLSSQLVPRRRSPRGEALYHYPTLRRRDMNDCGFRSAVGPM